MSSPADYKVIEADAFGPELVYRYSILRVADWLRYA
jgi:hypothetical protein